MGQAGPSDPRYKRYVLGVLTLVYTLNYLDQGLVSLLLQPIKVDLHLSDSQLGLVSGIAFALFYATLGVPIAWWADRGNRSTIAALAIGLWGATVMLCVTVTNYTQLVIARVIAGVGEAGGMPATYSLLGAYFPSPSERTRAMTVYMLAGPLATIISFVGGGWLNDHVGWRKTFLLLGCPGLLVAGLVKLTVFDPRASGAEQRRPEVMRGRVLDVAMMLWRRNSTRNLTVALVLLYTLGSGLSSGYGSFLLRSHAMSTSEAGGWLGGIFGLAGLVGILAGGYVSRRCFFNNEQGQMRVTALVTGSLLPFIALFLLLPRKAAALASLVPVAMAFNFFFGPTFALLQRLVVDEVRATTVAIVMLFANLIGMGLGPQVIGVSSDWLHGRYGEDALRYAMLSMSTIALACGYYFWQAGKSIQVDLLAVRAPD